MTTLLTLEVIGIAWMIVGTGLIAVFGKVDRGLVSGLFLLCGGTIVAGVSLLLLIVAALL